MFLVQSRGTRKPSPSRECEVTASVHTQRSEVSFEQVTTPFMRVYNKSGPPFEHIFFVAHTNPRISQCTPLFLALAKSVIVLAKIIISRMQAKSVYTRGFQFTQLEQSPHVRAAGRGLFHGSWARRSPPPLLHRPPSSTTSSSSDPCSELELESQDGAKSSEDEVDATDVAHVANEKRAAGEGGENETTITHGDEPLPDEVSVGNGHGIPRDADTETTTAGVTHKARCVAWGLPKLGLGGRRGVKAYGVGEGEDADDIHTSNAHSQKGVEDRRKIMGRMMGSGTSKGTNAWGAAVRKQELQPHGEGYVEFLDGWGVSLVCLFHTPFCCVQHKIRRMISAAATSANESGDADIVTHVACSICVPRAALLT